MNWAKNPEMVERLLVLARTGASAADIAKELGGTRNSIIGAARRNFIELKCKGGSFKPGNRAGARPRRPRKVPSMPAINTLTPRQPTPPATPAPAQPCTILELDNHSCRWILTDTAPWTYCGSPEADLNGGVAYCRQHAGIAYHRPGRREVAA